VPYGNLIYIFLAPFLLIYNSNLTIIIIESVWIAIGSFFLFKITKKESGSMAWAFALQSIYILYPTNYAILTNGPEFEILLPTFVLMSYYFFKRGNYLISVIAALLGSMTSEISPFIIVVFFIIEDYRLRGYSYRFLNMLLRKRGETVKMVSLRYGYPIWLFVIGIVSIVLIMVIKTPIHTLLPPFLSSIDSRTVYASTGNVTNSFISKFTSLASLKVSYFYDTFGGFLFIPLVSPYAVLIVPYFLLTFWASYPPYYYMMNHSVFVILPFFFLGLVYNVRNVKLSRSKLRKLMVALIIAMFFSFLLYSPFSVTNLENGTLHSELTVNTEDQYLNVAFSLIPENASVFSQNAFPQLMNRVNFYMPPYNYDNQTVDYAVISPISPATYLPNFLGFNPFWGQHFANNSSYGVFEFVEGVTVFKLNYHSPPVIFIPLTLNYKIDTSIPAGFVLSNPVYRGIYQYYPPGEYRFTYTLKVNAEAYSNLSLGVQEKTENNQGRILPSSVVNFSGMQEKNGYIIFSTMQNLTSYEVEYQPNLIIREGGGILTVPIEMISLEIVSISIK
jgi:uncharacterized membrane protein